MILQNGARVRDRYLIDSLVGQGGMGAVYRATDLHLGHSVAIKENLLQGGAGTEGNSDSTGQTDSRRSQFEREAQILARLKHPGLPKVTDHFVIPDQGQYLVMEFVEGEDLSTRLKRTGAMTELEAVALIRRVCGILSYLHSQKPPIIHRDIKPANIRQTPEGEIVVVDFGVAKIFSTEATVTAARAVTPGFSPLEQYGGSQSTDERSDIYALGATLHQLVTGKRPPEATTRITQASGKTMGWLDLPGVSDMLATIIRKATELRPEDRYPKIADFARVLEEVEAANSMTQTRPALGMGVGAELSPTAPVPSAPSGAAPTPTVMTPPPAAAAPPTAPSEPATFAVPPPAPVVPPPPPPAPVAAAPTAPAPSPSVVGGPAYGPPPVEKGPNRMPLFIGVGVLILALAGGGYMMFGRGSAPKPSGGTSGDLLAGSSTQTPATSPSVDDRDNTAELPAAGGGDASSAPSTNTTSSNGSNTAGSSSSATTTGGRPATPPPASNPPAPVSTPAAPAVTPPKPAPSTPANTTGGGTVPPASNASSTPTTPSKPPSGGSGSDLVPLTDNPGGTKPPASSGSSGSSTPQTTPSQSTPPQTTPVQTPPQVVPPVSSGSSPGTSTPPAPAVVPVPVLRDTLIIDPTGGGDHGSLSDAIQAWQEAYEKDHRVRTMLLKPGTYSRNTTLFMGNAGRLIGSGAPGSVVIAYSGSNPAVSLEGTDILMKNITVRSDGKSALSISKGQARIENCEFTSNGSHAVQLTGSRANVSFSRCRLVTSNGRGLLLVNGAAKFDNCDVTGNDLGVEVAGGSLSMTGGSVKDNEGTGIRTRGTGRADFSNVMITGNARHGVLVEGGAITLTNCTVTGNSQSGLFCVGGGRVTISGGDFTKNLTGAIVDSCGTIAKSGSIRE